VVAFFDASSLTPGCGSIKDYVDGNGQFSHHGK
jgi:hypothetical protein